MTELTRSEMIKYLVQGVDRNINYFKRHSDKGIKTLYEMIKGEEEYKAKAKLSPCCQAIIAVDITDLGDQGDDCGYITQEEYTCSQCNKLIKRI